MTPLHYAALDGHAQTCSELISHGADLNIKYGWGNTCIHFNN